MQNVKLSLKSTNIGLSHNAKYRQYLVTPVVDGLGVVNLFAEPSNHLGWRPDYVLHIGNNTE